MRMAARALGDSGVGALHRLSVKVLRGPSTGPSRKQPTPQWTCPRNTAGPAHACHAIMYV